MRWCTIESTTSSTRSSRPSIGSTVVENEEERRNESIGNSRLDYLRGNGAY